MNELKVLVSEMNNYAIMNNWVFVHDFVSGSNQQMNEGNAPSQREVFLQLYDVKPNPTPEQIGVDFSAFNVDIFLGMKSDIGEVFYEQNKGVQNDVYRFDKYFVPLFDDMKSLINYMSVCKSIAFESISPIIKRINYQDHNLDGYLITSTIKIY